MKTWTIALLVALVSPMALADYYQDHFNEPWLDTNSWAVQSSPGFSVGLQTNSIYGNDGQSLYFHTSAFSVGQASLTTTFQAQGDFTATVNGWNYLNTVGVDNSSVGHLGLRMTTAQGYADVYFPGGGDMFTSLNFAGNTNATMWGVGLLNSGSYPMLQIWRTRNTLDLGFNAGAGLKVYEWTDPSVTGDVTFSLYLSYQGLTGNHTLDDNGWFDNFNLTADHLSIPEPGQCVLSPFLALAITGLMRRRKKNASYVAHTAPRVPDYSNENEDT